jgi:hypothetical protein
MTPGKEERRHPGLINATKTGATSPCIETPALHAPQEQKLNKEHLRNKYIKNNQI